MKQKQSIIPIRTHTLVYSQKYGHAEYGITVCVL